MGDCSMCCDVISYPLSSCLFPLHCIDQLFHKLGSPASPLYNRDGSCVYPLVFPFVGFGVSNGLLSCLTTLPLGWELCLPWVPMGVLRPCVSNGLPLGVSNGWFGVSNG